MTNPFSSGNPFVAVANTAASTAESEAVTADLDEDPFEVVGEGTFSADYPQIILRFLAYLYAKSSELRLLMLRADSIEALVRMRIFFAWLPARSGPQAAYRTQH